MVADLRSSGFVGAIEIWDDVRGIRFDDDVMSRRQPWYFNVLVEVTPS